MVLCQRPQIAADTYNIYDSEFVDQLVDQISNATSIYHKTEEEWNQQMEKFDKKEANLPSPQPATPKKEEPKEKAKPETKKKKDPEPEEGKQAKKPSKEEKEKPKKAPEVKPEPVK